MNKIKFLALTTISFLSIGLINVNAASYTKEVTNMETNNLNYSITITSEGLSEGLELNATETWDFSYIDDNHKVYSDYLYNYGFINPLGAPPSSFNGKTATILIHSNNLVEGTKYKVYYIKRIQKLDPMTNGMFPVNVIDTDIAPTEAIVEKINNKLYIKFTTSEFKNFVLDREVSPEYKKKLSEITKDNIYTLNAIDPKDDEYFEIYSYFVALNKKIDGHVIQMAPDTTREQQYLTVEFIDLPGEKHIVEYAYKTDKINPKIRATMNKIVSSLKNDLTPFLFKEFVIEDLNYINYLHNIKNNEVDPVYYSTELRDILKGTNFIPFFDYRMGDNSEFNKSAFGFVSVSYDDILYPLGIDGGYSIKQVIYVPSDTANNDTALINAAKKRITEILGIDEKDFSLTLAGTRDSLENPGFDIWQNYDKPNLSANYYNLTINGQTVKMVIERNSEKAKKINFVTTDLLSEIEISTEFAAIPLDTKINVEKINEDSEIHKDIISTLGVTEGESIDLKLYSASLDKNITESNHGNFAVKVPIDDTHEAPDLSAYYIDQIGNIEEHKMIKEKIEGKDYYVFITDHFSVYTIAEAGLTEKISVVAPVVNIIENPNTSDNILNIIILGVTSLITLIILSTHLNKKNLIKKQ